MNALVSLVTLPFTLAARLIGLLVALAVGVVKLAGRTFAFLLGLALLIVGVPLTLTFVGAVVGVPLCVFGAILVFKVAL